MYVVPQKYSDFILNLEMTYSEILLFIVCCFKKRACFKGRNSNVFSILFYVFYYFDIILIFIEEKLEKVLVIAITQNENFVIYEVHGK